MTGRGQGRIAAVVVSAVLVVAGAAFAIYAASVAGQRSTALTETSTGNLVVFAAGHQRPVQPAELPRLGGGAPIELAARGGHPMVVNFFASWCTACQRELKAVAEVAGEKRVSFYGVDTDDPNHGLALLLLRRAGAHFPVGVGSAPVPLSYGTGNLPTTAFVNSKGRIVALALGAVTRTELTGWVNDLLSGRNL